MLPSQCRAARALLKWTQDDLAKKSGVSAVTIRKFENGRSAAHLGTLTLLNQAFEAAGIEFIPENGGGAGARLKEKTANR